jgi:N,N-dimethylformamidase
MMDIRPQYRFWLTEGGWALSSDMYLVDWLEAEGIAYDVITDHDLHGEGAELLDGYRAVITGSHPEYISEAMMDAFEEYTGHGGRLMYLGGNGFFWVTAIHPEAPHAIEVRRGFSGTRPWTSAPGEVHLAATGEPGGMWRHRGRPPQRLAGVGYTSQGSDAAVPFRRLPGSRDPRAEFIFAGVGDEPIGDGGLVLDGAGGAEVDRYDPALGTPPHALRLATTTGFSDAYQLAIEEISVQAPNQGGTTSERVRADLTFFEGPHDGAVFSTGSIAWCGSLSHNGYDNPVSRITENVLRAFASRGPLHRDL